MRTFWIAVRHPADVDAIDVLHAFLLRFSQQQAVNEKAQQGMSRGQTVGPLMGGSIGQRERGVGLR